MKARRLRHCFSCGAVLGYYEDHEPLDTCGAVACEREARDQMQAEREEAHEQLDRDMGY